MKVKPYQLNFGRKKKGGRKMENARKEFVRVLLELPVRELKKFKELEKTLEFQESPIDAILEDDRGIKEFVNVWF